MIKKLLFGGIGTGSPLGDFVLAVLRIVSGGALSYLHGWGKIQNPEMLINASKSMGFPAPTVFGWIGSITEFVLAITLALGVFTRFSALMLVGMMSTAAFIAHRADPLERRELALLYLAISLLFLVLGSGRFGIDALIRRGGGGGGGK
jgi:putative oxidoreductase